jgi:putative tryptophan/tyrosine transport system substrate-binding protein
MRRREFLGVLGGAAAAWPLVARAQQPAMPVVGLFHVGSSDKFGHLVTAFRRGLVEADLVEGRNVAIEYRWAEGQLDRLPALAADLIRRQVSVIAGNYIATAAVRRVAPTLPIVFVTGDDPVKLGFVESLNRPGGNTTGVYIFTAELEAKRLGLLRDLVPQATTFAVLVDPDYSTTDAQVRDVQKASARLGAQLVVARANSERDIDAAFATFVQQRAAALLVGASPFFNNRRDQLVALAARHNLPATYESREFAAAGGLVSYGNSITDAYRQAGVYAGSIVKGAKPADLPVIQPSKFELVINLKTARALGVAISGNLLTLADEVIE